MVANDWFDKDGWNFIIFFMNDTDILVPSFDLIGCNG